MLSTYQIETLGQCQSAMKDSHYDDVCGLKCRACPHKIPERLQTLQDAGLLNYQFKEDKYNIFYGLYLYCGVVRSLIPSEEPGQPAFINRDGKLVPATETIIDMSLSGHRSDAFAW